MKDYVVIRWVKTSECIHLTLMHQASNHSEIVRFLDIMGLYADPLTVQLLGDSERINIIHQVPGMQERWIVFKSGSKLETEQSLKLIQFATWASSQACLN